MQLEARSIYCKIIEKNADRCTMLAENLNKTVVLHGDGSDQACSAEEHIGDIDVVVTLTNDEETNILASLLARRMGARKAITKINKFSYFPLMTAIGIEQVVSTRLSAINTILQHIRRGKVLSAISLKGEQAEALEAVALETSDIVGKPLKRIAFPKGAIVASIIREEQVIIPTGDSVIQPDDRVIIFAQRRAIGGIEKFWPSSWSISDALALHPVHPEGSLMLFFGLTMLLPLGFGCYYGDASVAPAAIDGPDPRHRAVLLLCFRRERGAATISQREGMAIVAVGWTAIGFFGALPFYLGREWSFVDAFFESVSGFTTTGASILTDIESLPAGLLLWRSLIQWLGGMGIIVLSIAILPFLGVGGMQLYKAEVPTPVPDKLKPRIRDTAKILWKVYALFTLARWCC
jgi:Trk K+ transport system NAD-binding subunit